MPREEHEEEQEEVLEDETSCYIKIEQDKMTGKELVKINRGELVMAFAEAAIEYELDDPIPDRGVGRRGPTGPYIIYVSESDADKFLQNKASLFVGQGDNRVMCSLSKHVTRLVDDPIHHCEPEDETNPVHVTHYLDPTSPMFLKVNTLLIKKFWQSLGCRVTRANRENTSSRDSSLFLGQRLDDRNEARLCNRQCLADVAVDRRPVHVAGAAHINKQLLVASGQHHEMDAFLREFRVDQHSVKHHLVQVGHMDRLSPSRRVVEGIRHHSGEPVVQSDHQRTTMCQCL